MSQVENRWLPCYNDMKTFRLSQTTLEALDTDHNHELGKNEFLGREHRRKHDKITFVVLISASVHELQDLKSAFVRFILGMLQEIGKLDKKDVKFIEVEQLA